MFLLYHSIRRQSIARVSSAVIETDELKDEGMLPRTYWFSPGEALRMLFVARDGGTRGRHSFASLSV